jgi:hypothetical protein
VKQTFTWLEWILWRDNKPNFCKVTSFSHQISNDEMAHMDWIERTEEEAYFSLHLSKVGVS